MTDKHVQSEAPQSNMEKDPSDWVTGDEAMTGAQKSYLKTLSEEAKVEFDESLTKAEASERIDALQQRTGRGAHGGHGQAAASKRDVGASDTESMAGHSRQTSEVHDKGNAQTHQSAKNGDAPEEADLFDANAEARQPENAGR